MESEPEEPNLFQQYVDTCFEKIRKTKLVKDVIIVNRRGIPLKSTFGDPKQCLQQTGLFLSMYDKAVTLLRQLDGEDEFLILRVKANKNEAVISTDPEHQLVFVVVQEPK